MKRLLKRALLVGIILLALVAIAIVARGYFAFRDRIPGYSLAVDIAGAEARSDPRPLRVGFARAKITPDISDPKHPVWLAGFSQHRAATAVHDDLWSIACVIDDGYSRIGFVGLDAIGFFQDDVVKVRRALDGQVKLDFITVCSTHNHSTPDLIGLWGPNFARTGVDPVYRQRVIDTCIKVLTEASSNLQPARVTFEEIKTDPAGLVGDSRKPTVFDPDIRVMHFRKPENGTTIGSLVTWGDHPETVWGRNTEITADYCGYLRDTLENGITIDGTRKLPGLGGIHLYINGAVGGLMTTGPGLSVRDPVDQKDYKQPSHDKARALGCQIASRVLERLAQTNAPASDHLALSVHARSFEVHLHNNLYLLAGFLGLIDRGYVHWRTLRTEAALISLSDDAAIACVPGEIYPEIVNGGIEKPEGADYDGPIVETPPIREFMPGRVKFLFGLANDEIGYIIPKTQWDEKAPYTYGYTHAPYGEVNSLGPEAAPAIHHLLLSLCRPETQKP